jgi:hypothetical protein
MKKVIGCIIVLGMVCIFGNVVDAAENLNDWTEEIYSGSVQFTPNGTSVSMGATGTSAEDGWGNINKYFEGATGMLATVNCSEANGTAEVGIWKYVGATSTGNMIQAVLKVKQYNGKRYIYYFVRERNQSHIVVRMLAFGNLGASEGTWSEGQDITIGFSRIGNEIWFYTPETGAFVKVQPFTNMGNVSTANSNCFIAIIAARGSENSVNATVNNVQILKLTTAP